MFQNFVMKNSWVSCLERVGETHLLQGLWGLFDCSSVKGPDAACTAYLSLSQYNLERFYFSLVQKGQIFA